MSAGHEVTINLELVNDYEFRVRFAGTDLPELATDESAPLGHDAGPNPARLLLTAVANCLAASLLFALRKYRNTPAGLKAEARATMTRNAAGRLRITAMHVDLHLADATDALQHIERALAQFEDFCIVTESVRAGIPVAVQVHDDAGRLLHATTPAGAA